MSVAASPQVNFSDFALAGWLDRPRPDRGIVFRNRGNWVRFSYPEAASYCQEAAGHLVERNVGKGSVVALALPNSIEFMAAFYGTVVAGGIPCPLTTPGIIGGMTRYREHIASILRVARPAVVITLPRWRDSIGQALAASGCDATVTSLELSGAPARLVSRPASDIAILQFTSGSTGHPRGIEISRSNLEANISMIQAWTGIGDHDRAATWLPMFHDMGLIGGLLTPVESQAELFVLNPRDFVLSPLSWLECLGRLGATISASPCFGLEFSLQHVSSPQLDGMDFAALRHVLVGSDRIRPEVLSRFSRTLAPYGFRSDVLLPGYGLAEATLVVSGGSPGTTATTAEIDWSRLRMGAAVEVWREGLIDAAADRPHGRLVNCGRALPGMVVDVVDDEGGPLPDTHLGEIRVRGPSVASGYRVDGGDKATRFSADGLLTGDAGFLRHGDLYVVGRIGDSVKVRGHSIYMEDMDAVVADATGLAPDRCVALAGLRAEGQVVVAVVESDTSAWAERLTDALYALVTDEVGVIVTRGRRGSIQRTSSGKPRRRLMWQALVEGRLPVRVLHDGRQHDRQHDRHHDQHREDSSVPGTGR